MCSSDLLSRIEIEIEGTKRLETERRLIKCPSILTLNFYSFLKTILSKLSRIETDERAYKS